MNTKPKLKKISRITHILLLSIMVFGSVFAYFSVSPVSEAQAACDISKWTGSFQLDRSKVFLTEEGINAYIDFKVPAEQAQACASDYPTVIARVYPYYFAPGSNAWTYNDFLTYNLPWVKNDNFTGYQVNVNSMSVANIVRKTTSVSNTGVGAIDYQTWCKLDLSAIAPGYKAKVLHDKYCPQQNGESQYKQDDPDTADYGLQLYAYVKDPQTGSEKNTKSLNGNGLLLQTRYKTSLDSDHRVAQANEIPKAATSVGDTGNVPTGPSTAYKAEDFQNVNIQSPASVYRVSLQTNSSFPQSVGINTTVKWGNDKKPVPKKGDTVNVVIPGVTQEKGNDNTIGDFYVAANYYYGSDPTPNCAQYDQTVLSQYHWYDGLLAMSGLGLSYELFNTGGKSLEYLFRDGCPNKLIESQRVPGLDNNYGLSISSDVVKKVFTLNNSVTPGIKAFVLYPVVGFSGISADRDLALVNGADKARFEIRLFQTDDELKADCKKSNANLKDEELNAKNCGASGEAINADVGSNQTSLTTCKSNSLICFLRDVVVFVVSLVRQIIYTIFFYVLLPIMQAVLSIRTYTDTFSSIIYPGWVIIRNVCNVFLILAMLIIGLATLFRVEGYNYKQLLVKVILAAIFVNFSLVLAQGVLGIADTVQNQFLPNATEPLNQLGSALMVGNVSGSFPSMESDPSGFSDIVFAVFQLGLTIGSFIAFAAITALLIVRLVALWILLMVSPVAWVADVLPATAKYRGEWWSNFLKYAFFAPIMGFFLNLTAVISLTIHDKLILITGDNFTNSANGTGEMSTFIFKVASNVLLIAFLVAAVMVAQTFGIKGAEAAVGAVTKGVKSPFGAALWGAKGLGSVAMRTYSAYMGTKAFEAVQGEIKAQQAKNAALAKRAELQQDLADLRATPNYDRAAARDLENKIHDMDHAAHTAEHEEHRQAKRKRNFGLAQFLNPQAVKKGWEDRKQILENRAYKPAAGSVHDVLNRYMPTEWGIFHKGRTSKLGRISDYGFVDKLGVIRDEAKHLEGLSLNRNFASYVANNAAHSGSVEEKFGADSIIARQNQQDDVANLYNAETGFSYSGYGDLMYHKNHVWKGMSSALKEISATKILEEQEHEGRSRSMFFDEDTNTTIDDLSHMQDPAVFEANMKETIANMRELNIPRYAQLADQFEAAMGPGGNMQSIDSIVDSDNNPRPGMEQAHEWLIANRESNIVTGKKKRGQPQTWFKSMNPAEVRRQTTRGWREYTPSGLMKLLKNPKAHMQVYFRRMHQGEARTAVFSGAMVDPTTKEIILPRSPAQLQQAGVQQNTPEYTLEAAQYKEFQDVSRVNKEMGAATWTYFHHPERVNEILDKVQAKELDFLPDQADLGPVIMGTTTPYNFQRGPQQNRPPNPQNP